MGFGPGSALFFAINGWISWFASCLMITGVATVCLGISLSLTSNSQQKQLNFWGIVVGTMGNFLMGVAVGLSLYEIAD